VRRLYRGKVTRTSTAGVWVEIASTWPGIEWGPLPLVANVVRTIVLTTSTDGTHPHSHTVAKDELRADLVEVGDSVLIAQLERDDFVVIGTLRGGVTSNGQH
jgi:hypothetical protein